MSSRNFHSISIIWDITRKCGLGIIKENVFSTLAMLQKHEGVRGGCEGVGESGVENHANTFHWLCELKNKKAKSFRLDILKEDSLKPHKNSEAMSEKAFYFLGHS